MMDWGYYGMHFNTWAPFAGIGMFFGLAIMVWSLYWKGMSMWKAANKGDRNWFIALLILNTLGILDILYIHVFSKPKAEAAPPAPEVKQ